MRSYTYIHYAVKPVHRQNIPLKNTPAQVDLGSRGSLSFRFPPDPPMPGYVSIEETSNFAYLERITGRLN